MKKLILALIILATLIISILPFMPVFASVKYEYYSAGDTNISQSQGGNGRAQTFTAASNHTMTSVKIKAYKVGTPGDAYIHVRGVDGSHKPTGADLGVGHASANGWGATPGAWWEITLDASVSLTSGTEYSITLLCPDAAAGNAANWRFDDSGSSSYSGGLITDTANGGSTFGATDSGRDQMFEIYGPDPSAPTVTTQAASSVSYTTATGNGNITDVSGGNATHRGIAYSTSNATPTTSDSTVDESGSYGTGAFTESLTSLASNTLFYARAYATNANGTAYGSVVQFTTLNQSPTVTTQAASSVTMDKDGTTNGTFNGNLTNLGDDTSADVSAEYGLTTGYGSATATTNKGSTGTFTRSIPTNLTPGATYHTRSKATNAHGDSYGGDQSFTFTMPTFTTQSVTTAYTLKGNVSAMGAASTVYVYFDWGYTTSYGNTTADQTLSGTGDFTQALTGYLHGVPIFYRANIRIGATVVHGASITYTFGTTPIGEYGSNLINWQSTSFLAISNDTPASVNGYITIARFITNDSNGTATMRNIHIGSYTPNGGGVFTTHDYATVPDVVSGGAYPFGNTEHWVTGLHLAVSTGDLIGISGDMDAYAWFLTTTTGTCYKKAANDPTIDHETLTLDSGVSPTIVGYIDTSSATAISEVLWYQPNAIISGTTLPDRDAGDGTQNGVITWGTGLEATLGPILAPTPTPPATTPGGFLPTPTPTGGFGGNPPGTVGDTPVALYWFLITGFVILVISITLSWAMRRFGSGGLIIKGIVVMLLMGILVAVDIYYWWMIVLYLLPVIAAMFASQDARRA